MPPAARTFPIGKKQVFLPKFSIALLRRGAQRPNFATFKVPLRFNKFDLRDYLLHVYNVAALNVRSHLKPRQAVKKRNGHVVRPLPAKIMTIEMEKPFVWPERPADPTPWYPDVERHRTKAMNNKFNPQKELRKKGTLSLRDERKPSKVKIELRKAAEKLLKAGSWSNEEKLDPKFSDPKFNVGKKDG
ncbi:uncharacterized protein GGS22DRAFT_65272 [Annulohypoxylon maeteangense]|uniref:uncharacterized protein n=1 Tax=Annulohypoxylon maeteangense TaxID=1927788 RepID=UPI002007803B|nr:uncharacterized protein GGS22DRAFT_65272 [Annulohypoxylon maeteangense]KAI0888946.1 hypothetical protein GGS22DRAFT_65272 [Annulohypoxylon maeteangense]